MRQKAVWVHVIVALGVIGLLAGPPGLAAPLVPVPVSPIPSAPFLPPPSPTPTRPWLRGWVDLHTHPMAHLAFGGMLINGAPDVGSLRRGGCEGDKYGRVRTPEEALRESNWIHGGHGVFDNPCGDHLRKQFVDQLQRANQAKDTPDNAWGYPNFPDWPAWDDIVHQKMYVDWIERAHRLGLLRVMVALAVNNKTLADSVRGPGDNLPNTDKESADLQIEEMKRFVGRHSGWMEIAYTAADLRRIVGAGRLAVVLGLELDALGNFYRTATPAQVEAELDRLYNVGVRYLIPVAHIDNAFGGTAVYNAAFNLSNYREFGSYWRLRTATEPDGTTFCYRHEGASIELLLFAAVKLGTRFPAPPPPPACPHKNARGLQRVGEHAIRYMMRRGFLIDIDHMSDLTADRVLDIAESVPDGGYPLNSGHTGIRPTGRVLPAGVGENTRTVEQLRRIAALGGMFGLGTDSATIPSFVSSYAAALSNMGWRAGEPSPVAIGSDANGLVKLPRPTGELRESLYGPSFPPPETMRRTWDLRTDGVAHYGMFADFLRAVSFRSPDTASALWTTAEAFARMWEKAERQRSRVVVR